MSRTSKSLKAIALVLSLAVSDATSAQTPGSNSLFSATPSTGLILPAPSGRSDVFAPGGALGSSSQSPLPAPDSAASAPMAPMPMVPAGQVALALSARFGKDAPAIGGGLGISRGLEDTTHVNQVKGGLNWHIAPNFW